jgi:TonB-linked SusC/RagA family outer membrane protein
MKQKHTRKGAKSLLALGYLFALLFSGTGLYAQSRQITGVVTDANGPLAGVTVSVQGTSTGTLTNGAGRYVIQAAADQTLVFGFMGYNNRQEVVGTRNVIDVSLDEAVTGLDEVVVVGYGNVRRRDLIGAVSSVRGEALTLSPAANPMVNIQGKVPGLDITQPSGQPGAKMDIQLRGNRSITADSNPLFLIDGMPGDYATLNPNDILSIEVLKDASSTSVYGARGANGVIIITTKKPEAGRVSIDFNAYYGFNGWSILPEMRGDGPQYINALRDAAKAAGRDIKSDADLFTNPEDYELYKGGHFLNWNDAVMQNASIQNYSISVSGGNEKTKAYMSLNYSNEVGQYKADEYKLYSTVMRVENQTTKWMKIGANLTGSYVDRSKAYANLDNAMRMYPLGKIYNDDGSLNPLPVSSSRVFNLLLNNQDGVYDDLENNFRVNINPYIEVTPLPGLTILSRANASLMYNKAKYFQGFESYKWYEAGNTDASVLAKLTQNRSYDYMWENIVTYNRNFNSHDFTLTGVSTWNHYQKEDSWMQQTGIKDNIYKWDNFDSTSTSTTGETDYSMFKVMGLIGRVNYSYNGKYLASASVRYDGSSKLYKDKRWSTFPAFSLGWRISEENFMAGTKSWLGNLKLRGNWGITGTDNINPYSSVQTLEDGTQLVGGVALPIWKFSRKVTNPDLGWEKSKTIDLGIDLTLFRGRVDLVLDWYNTQTDGVIYDRPLPITSGTYSSSQQYLRSMNIAATKNTGWEVALNTINIDRAVRWTSTVTFSANKEEITKLFGESSEFLDTRQTTGYVLKVGEAVNSYWDYKLNGIWQLSEAADAKVFNLAPGDIKIDIPGMYKESDGKFYKFNDKGEKVYYDADHKYTIGSEFQILGQKSPKWQLGFQNTLKYKGIDISVYAFARMGHMFQYELLGSFDPKGIENFPTYFDYWTEDNPSNKYPMINADREKSSYPGLGSLSYVDGSFFKIKNITLGYTLPQSLTKKLQISRLRIYGTITNPVVVARSSWIKQYDPEMAGSLNYPLTKQLVFGINLTF